MFATVVVISAGYYLLGYPDGPGWVGLFVATYTLTAHGTGEASLRLVAGALGGLIVVWLATADLVPLAGAGWVFFRIGAAVMAAALGESANRDDHRCLAEPRARIGAAATSSRSGPEVRRARRPGG